MRDELLHRATDLKVIPTLNNIMQKVLAVMGDRNSSFADLGNVIKHDQAISSKVISIANSAYYSRGIEIFSLERAMISMGFEEVKSIVMCILFMDTMLKAFKLREEDLKVLWNHSIYVACAAKVLAEKTCADDAQKVYSVALLHDIGKVVFYMGADNYSQLAKEAEARGKEIHKLERERFGIDHQETGYVLGLKWKFPEELCDAIRYHHEMKETSRYQSLVSLVKSADRFSLAVQPGSDRDGYILIKAKDAIEREVQKIKDFLSI